LYRHFALLTRWLEWGKPGVVSPGRLRLFPCQKGIVAAGVCAALLPRLALEPGDRNLEIASLPPEFAPRVIALVQRADRYSTPAMADFVQTSVSVCAALIDSVEASGPVRLAG
jgi:DNA-binding transcriptional LysR family regulator